MSNSCPDTAGSCQKGGRNGRGQPAFRVIAGVIWLSGIVASLAFIARYSGSPGLAGETPQLWPAASHVGLSAARPTLIMFAHPHCPCTRASLLELDQLMADCQGRLDAQVWFVKPAGTEENWTNTDLWSQAAAIPGVTVHCDAGGIEAQRFQAETSGQTLLYDRKGRLLFHGGITIARGHAGDNPGLDGVEALLKNNLTNQFQTPVFGCGLATELQASNQIICTACKR
jgi:hypothetical protein